ncbi:MAG: nitroreductase family protein [Bacteroidales bacterium]|nr:nitroreductase family protein [Bacteroidales bacterium]
MKKHIFTFAFVIAVMAIHAQNIQLPAPQRTGGMSLMEALDNRMTHRNFSDRALSHQQLSNLLWAASGVNRDDGSHRMTAPTAGNSQQMVIFVALPNAVYRYLPQTHELQLHVEGDHRAAFGRQAFVATAPVVIGIVADWNRMERWGSNKAEKMRYSHTDAGYVSQNIYLWTASERMGSVAIGNFDSRVFTTALGLGSNFYPVLNHAVGFIAN